MTPVNWKGRQKKDRNVSTLGAKISSPKTEMEPEKGPLGERRAKKKNGLPAVSFLGCTECTVYQRCFGISTFYVGLRFFSWQGFLTWPGSLFSGSISASEELHAVEGSNILNGDEEIKEEIDDAFRMVSVRMVSVEL